VAAALGWGALAASSLVIGALLSVAREWPPRLVGLVLAFGAGALISAVSFELAEEGVAIGGAIEQEFTLFVTEFFVEPGADDFSALAGDE
jgi:zinc transporter ZupT